MSRSLFALLACAPSLLAEPLPPNYTIPTVDIAANDGRQVVVDREAGQYLGHPTTVLLEDGKTILTVYPKGHGKGEKGWHLLKEDICRLCSGAKRVATP